MHLARWIGIAAIVVFLGIQLVPYGRAHTNPPVRQEPPWDSPQTRELTVRACYDCHSNETTWPWYSYVAPTSWLIQRDVDQGRREVNYSEWDRPQREARESAETVQRGTMPPWYYTLLHPAARLSPSEREALIRGLEATFGQAR
jgi:hypothetical protein